MRSGLGRCRFCRCREKIQRIRQAGGGVDFRDSLSKALKKEVGAKNIRYLDDILEHLIV